jgi:two-component system CheB/CheR fusion protein
MSGADDASELRGPGAEGDGLHALLDHLSLAYNFDFREYKEPSLARRIRTRMALVHVETFEGYIQYLQQHPSEHVALFNAILINVTGFFRDPEAWKVLGEEIVPRIVESAGASRPIRIWSAGCSSGEEPYSIAILLAEHLGERAGAHAVKIYGTDVDEDALASARHAAYRLDQLKDVPDEMVSRYFFRDGQLYRLRRDLRRWCIFGAHNLTQAPPLSHVDLLLCRNVLIYFTSDLQERVLARFHYALRDDGFLFLGRSESLLARSRLFRPIHLKWRIFQRAPAVARQAAAVLPEPEGEAGAETVEPPTEASAVPRLQRALDALPAAVMVVDTTDTIQGWNPAAEALFDVPVAAAVGRNFRDLDVSYRVEGLRARIEDVKTRHRPVRMESISFARRNGDTVHADISIVPFFESQRLVGVLVFAAEASELVRLKEQMGRIAEQHATAIEELQSTNEELETTNEELQSTNEELETTNEELQSTNEELETTVEELQAANTELGALNAELEGRTTELNRLDALHRGMINSLEAGLMVLDRDGVVTSWNGPLERLWGLPADRAVSRPFRTLPLGEVTEQVRGPLDRVLATGEAADVAGVACTLPGGAGRRGSLRLMPLRDGGGAVVGVIGLLSPAAAPPGRRG